MVSALTLAICAFAVLGGCHGKPVTIDEILREASLRASFSARPDDGTVVVEYDVLYRKQDYDALIARLEAADDGSKTKRKAVTNLVHRWPNAEVPYKINTNDFSADTIRVIKDSMAEWEARTCIKFREAYPGEVHYVQIQHGTGCNSFVGKQSWTGQVLNLDYGCRVKSVVIHELGHALGFHHEHHRPDRDPYITVLDENIQDSFVFALKKFDTAEINTYGMPYDYSSIMHYGDTAFTKNGQRTIITHDNRWQKRIGTFELPSFLDLKLANMIYSCDSHCGGQTCPDDGFVDKNCQCICRGSPTKVCGSSEPDGPGYECSDKNSQCQYWAARGECDINPAYMLVGCAMCCGQCDNLPGMGTPKYDYTTPDPNCQDNHELCSFWANIGECEKNPNYMLYNCMKSCHRC